MPGPPARIGFEVDETEPRALGGLATRKQVMIRLGEGAHEHALHLLLYLPNARSRPVSVFAGLNFLGNHTIHTDPGIRLAAGWIPQRAEPAFHGEQAHDAQRGFMARRWPVERILERGHGLATAYCGDLDPDFDDGFRNGVHPLLRERDPTHAEPDACGAIGAWAWGLQRVVDYLETDPAIDRSRIAAIGHSRLGKAALWAAATDPRLALVVSNNSGCGGAALSRRRFGETIELITARFPHWFCPNFARHARQEDALPVDQHQLLALVAPRPLYVASASEDLWADPRGEFLAALHADPVYRLLGHDGLEAREMPAPGERVSGRVGYHLRPGPHELTTYDWERFLDFAELQLARDGER
jgi:hypothetical protein